MPKFDDLIEQSGDSNYFRTDKQAEVSESTHFSRHEHNRSPRRNLCDWSRPKSPYVRSYPYRGNWRGQTQRGWSRSGYDRAYAQPDRRSFNHSDNTQSYYTRKLETVPRLFDLKCQRPVHRNETKKETAQNNDGAKQAGTLDLTSLNPELLNKIQELLKIQK